MLILLNLYENSIDGSAFARNTQNNIEIRPTTHYIAYLILKATTEKSSLVEVASRALHSRSLFLFHTKYIAEEVFKAKISPGSTSLISFHLLN